VGTGRPKRRVRRQALARANELATDPAPHRALGRRSAATGMDLAAQLRHASLVVVGQVLGGRMDQHGSHLLSVPLLVFVLVVFVDVVVQ
jgi:hypothetical protein